MVAEGVGHYGAEVVVGVILRSLMPIVDHVDDADCLVAHAADVGTDAYGEPKLACLLAGTWTRQALQGVAWATADATNVAQDTGG
jgi:hypothetical protein